MLHIGSLVAIVCWLMQPHGMPVNLTITRRLAVNLPLSLAAEVERLARNERRSIASWLRNAIEDQVLLELNREQHRS